MFLNLHTLQILVPCIAGSASLCQAAEMVERREKPFNILKKVRKMRCANILEKSVLEKLGFLHLVLMKPQQGLGRENSPNSICRFVLFLHLVVKPLGMNVTLFPSIFIQKSRPCVLHTNLKHNNLTPMITIIRVPSTVLTFEVNRKSEQRRFWATLV